MIHPANYDLEDDDYDITRHEHQTPWSHKAIVHTHAYGSMEHGHMLRGICHAEECKGVRDTHNIHPAFKRTTEQERENLQASSEAD